MRLGCPSGLRVGRGLGLRGPRRAGAGAAEARSPGGARRAGRPARWRGPGGWPGVTAGRPGSPAGFAPRSGHPAHLLPAPSRPPRPPVCFPSPAPSAGRTGCPRGDAGGVGPVPESWPRRKRRVGVGGSGDLSGVLGPGRRPSGAHGLGGRPRPKSWAWKGAGGLRGARPQPQPSPQERVAGCGREGPGPAGPQRRQHPPIAPVTAGACGPPRCLPGRCARRRHHVPKPGPRPVCRLRLCGPAAPLPSAPCGPRPQFGATRTPRPAAFGGFDPAGAVARTAPGRRRRSAAPDTERLPTGRLAVEVPSGVPPPASPLSPNPLCWCSNPTHDS